MEYFALVNCEQKHQEHALKRANSEIMIIFFSQIIIIIIIH